MIDINPMLICDTYKCCHRDMYPEATRMDSYLTPRKSMFKNINKVVNFGHQFLLKEIKESFDKNFFNKPLAEILESYKKYMNIQLGQGVYNVESIIKLHELGHLPIAVYALPEGSLVNMGVPIAHFCAVDTKFSWLAEWFECWYQGEIWKICNTATIGYLYHQLAKKWYDKTVENGNPYFAMSDFGMRGMSCMEEAAKCSASWLLSFDKTSTIPALPWLDKYYDADVSLNHIGVGAVSVEHSVVSTNVANGVSEKDLIIKLLKQYNTTSFSYVADTYDYWNVVENILPSIKTEILAHKGKLLIRPDSGDQVEISVKTVQSLWNSFGGTENKKGYKVLNPHIGIILGDGCTLKTVESIYKKLADMKFAANNIVFGVGAFCFSAIFEENKMIINTRDTFGLAQKTTYIETVDGNERFVFKDPKTDETKLKKSHKGLVFVEKIGNDYIATDQFYAEPYYHCSQNRKDELRLVFRDGQFFNQENFIQIRERLANEVM